MSLELSRHDLTRPDGTTIAYYTAGPEDGPPLLVSCGLGGGLAAWTGVLSRFRQNMRIVVWDYRGLYASSPAADGLSYRMADHAADLGALIDHLKLDRPVLLGWSMGVQVNFELLHQRPGVARGLVAMHGAYRHPLDTAFNSKLPKGVPPIAFGGVRRYWRRLAPIIQRAGRSRLLAIRFMRGCQRLGLVSKACDDDMFYAMARDWVKLDLGIYADIFEQLAGHDAKEVLPSISIPMLIVGGRKDVLTPPELSEAMAERVPQAELFLLPDATHFGPLEYPDEIAARMETFLRERIEVGF